MFNSLIATNSFAQHNFSCTTILQKNQPPVYIPWLILKPTKQIYIEARYNWDWQKTKTLFLGYCWGDSVLNISLKSGTDISFSKKRISLDVFLNWNIQKYSFYSLNKYNWDNLGPDLFINWSDILFTPSPWLQPGIGVLSTLNPYLNNKNFNFELGPEIQLIVPCKFLFIKNPLLKTWITWNAINKNFKLFLISGFSF